MIGGDPFPVDKGVGPEQFFVMQLKHFHRFRQTP
jgi:hypothetical protein